MLKCHPKNVLEVYKENKWTPNSTEKEIIHDSHLQTNERKHLFTYKPINNLQQTNNYTKKMDFLASLTKGIPLNPLPKERKRNGSIPHAPNRIHNLDREGRQLAISNSLRYFPKEFHKTLRPEFESEFDQYGHIYMYRFVPDFVIKAYPLNAYPAKCKEGAAIMLMIMNNLDHTVAQFPEELITYGGNGQVFSNWAQFWLAMYYLSNLTQEQTMVLNSGHTHGMFPSLRSSSRLIISNGIMVPNYSSRESYDKHFALGVTMYGQMTAGSFCYIGPQGIVHGTTITILNAARKYLKTESLAGRVFVTSGLGGMSGAQPKAGVICGCITVIAEVSFEALQKRHKQGWLMEVESDLERLLERVRNAKQKKEALSIGYHGNVVDLWEKLVKVHQTTGEVIAELGSDQTSCHCPFTGGYYPAELTYEQAQEMIKSDPEQFRKHCRTSLIRQIKAINYLAENGMHFWDYGNAFLLEAHRAGAEVGARETPLGTRFRYPSYVQDIMGDIFSLGFGPFRWICTSGKAEDLEKSDKIALEIMEELSEDPELSDESRMNYCDNIRWIKNASREKLVVGSQARILYSNHQGRVKIAEAFSDAISNGHISAPIVISRDHHDVSGADSPYRETSNVYDGSAFTADMAVTTCIGNATRGATWVALHNGGGVGFGEVINCGFGMLLDGTDEAKQKAMNVLFWDVTNGLTRRSWSGNNNALQTMAKVQEKSKKITVTLPSVNVASSAEQFDN